MSKQLNIKKTRKHKGIHQTGGNKGKLKKGFKYSGKRLKSGLPQIIQVGGMKKNKYRQQLEDTIFTITPEDHYNEWKRLIPSYKYQLANFRDKYTEEEIAEREKYISDNLTNLIQYEKKHHIVNDSVEMLKKKNKNKLKKEIKKMLRPVEEIKNKIKEASDLITDTELKIQFNKVSNINSEKKLNSRILKEAKQFREKKKKKLEPLYDRLRIFSNRLRELELELETQLNQQIIPKKKKRLVINVGGKVKNLEKRFKKLLTSCS